MAVSAKEARKNIRQRFRRMVKNVIINRTWLAYADDEKMTLNVKHNVGLYLRQKRKIGIISNADKNLLRTPHAMRTVADRKKLVHLFAHLPCFAQFSPKIRARLVPVTNYMILGPNRMILREGDPPTFLYFILSGEIQVTQKVYDQIEKKYSSYITMTLGAEDMHGLNGMIERTPRLTTSRTITDVELLGIHYKDFVVILKPILEKENNEKKRCFEALGYFDKIPRARLAFRLAYLKQYEPLDSIYSEDKGPLTLVHFVVSGECMVLQCLRIKVTASKKGKEKIFELVKIKSGEKMETGMFQDMKGAASKNMNKEKDKTSGSFTDFPDDDKSKTELHARKIDIKSIEIGCGLVSNPKATEARDTGLDQDANNLIKPKIKTKDSSSKKHRRRMVIDNDDDFIDFYGGQTEHGEDLQESGSTFDEIESSSSKLSKSLTSEISMKDHAYEYEDEELIEEIDEEYEDEVSEESAEETYEELEDGDQIENHFIDVGSLTFGAIFGLGEPLEHRVIMARTTVQCIVLPRYWLFEKVNNPGGIWDRRRFYIECNIPSRRKLFEDFLTTRKWQKFKNDLIVENLGDAMKNNPTKVQDIPIICRIVEPHE